MCMSLIKTVYKVVYKKDNKFYTAYQDTPIELGTILRSDRESKEVTVLEVTNGYVSKGIHTFYKLADAVAEKRLWHSEGDPHYIIKCKVNMDDLVAIGYGGSQLVLTPVFMQVLPYEVV